MIRCASYLALLARIQNWHRPKISVDALVLFCSLPACSTCGAMVSSAFSLVLPALSLRWWLKMVSQKNVPFLRAPLKVLNICKDFDLMTSFTSNYSTSRVFTAFGYSRHPFCIFRRRRRKRGYRYLLQIRCRLQVFDRRWIPRLLSFLPNRAPQSQLSQPEFCDP